jgi:DNA polymerase elongation subunit (family B)
MWFSTGEYGSYKNLRPLPDDTTMPILQIMAYDLETTGLDPDTCTINQCCIVLWKTSDPVGVDDRTVVLVSQPTDVVQNTNIIDCGSEEGLLRKFRELVKKYDPDIMTGYNLSFDNGFLERRLANVRNHLYDQLGRPSHAVSSFKKQTLKSSALGTNERTLFDVPGRFVLDLFLYAKTNFPTMYNFKLNTVGNHFLGEGKVDMPFGKILEGFGEAGTPQLRGEIAHYCEIDGRLCLQLIQKWSAHVSCLEVSFFCASYIK